jgi:arabinogalactan oligomer / maltooligosaccharide transport system permease protein
MSSISQRGELSAFQRFWQSKKNQRRVTLTVKYIVAALVLTFSLFPIVWTISAAFNPSGGLSTQQLIPAGANLNNFREILVERPFWRWVWNSTRIALISSILSAAITTLTAFSFSRFRFRGRSQMLLGILLIQVFPALLAMVALFAILQQIGSYIPWLGLNSHGGLILIYLGGAMGINIWLMKGFFDTVPRAIDESAMVDGATHWQIFWYLVLPLVRPIIVVVAILTFFGTYSDWLMPRIMIQNTELYTLMLGLQTFIGDNYAQRWGTFAAGAVLGSIPMVTVYLILQDQIVGGLTSGSVKG